MSNIQTNFNIDNDIGIVASVTLNGEIVTDRCIEADTANSYVVLLVKNESGSFVLDENTHNVKTEKLFGIVIVELKYCS